MIWPDLGQHNTFPGQDLPGKLANKKGPKAFFSQLDGGGLTLVLTYEEYLKQNLKAFYK